MRKSISFEGILQDGTKRCVETFYGEYRNIMELLNERFFLDEFGDCGGMGRCATCIVTSIGIKGSSNQRTRNEPVTLKKFGYENSSFRLSCQILINSEIEGSVISLMV